MRKGNCTLYIETSLFGFYYDEKPENKEKREAVRKLFKQIKDGYFKYGFVSSVTLMELGEAKEQIRDKLLSLVPRYGLKEIEVDQGKVDKLTQDYIGVISVFQRWPDDARHIAVATVSGIDVLVTLNCEHIANKDTIEKVKEINKKEGYTKELDIRRPEEVIFYED